MRAMKLSRLRELHETRPFLPFTLTLADGRKLEVIHNEFLAIFPSGRTAVLTHPTERLTMFDLLMVTSADIDPKYNQRKKGPAKKR